MTGANGHDRSNVTSLEEARRRAAEKAKAAGGAGGPNAARGPRTARDWLIGGGFIALALAFLAWLLMTMTDAVRGGAA